MWWQPSLWAGRDWVKEGGVVRVLWILMVDVPEAESTDVGVTAREKISVLWAGKYVSIIARVE